MAKKELKWYKIFASIDEASTKVPLNTTKRARIGTQKVCIAHTSEGFFAVDDECTHMRASLTNGHLNNYSEVICPWHGYRFCLKTGEEKSGKNTYALETHKIEEREDGLYLGLYKDQKPPQKDEFSY
ncbi:MAG TPA: Rieske (2Fe-2S) protein [Microscillaceae bacterium]|nr:Rieske (2Fe-2S) protein [Microscillaceae bacterium]